MVLRGGSIPPARFGGTHAATDSTRGLAVFVEKAARCHSTEPLSAPATNQSMNANDPRSGKCSDSDAQADEHEHEQHSRRTVLQRLGALAGGVAGLGATTGEASARPYATPDGDYTLTVAAPEGAPEAAYSVTVTESATPKRLLESPEDVSWNGDGTVTLSGTMGDGWTDEWTCRGDIVSHSLGTDQFIRIDGQRVSLADSAESDTTDGGGAEGGETSADPRTHITFDGGSWTDAFGGETHPHDTVSSPSRSGNALRVQVPRGEHAGANMHYEFASTWGSRPDAVHARYWLRLGPNWGLGTHNKSWNTNGGKLPGFADLTHGSAHGGGTVDDSWSVRGAFRPPQSGGDTRLAWYSYLPGKDSGYGSSEIWNANGEIRFGKWYQIDQYVEMNDAGSSNGVLRAWVDGEQAYEDTSMRFRTMDNVAVGEWWLDVYMGGNWTAGQDMALYIDDVQLWERQQL